MINVKIIYQYDGSKFYGMQRQKDKKTVQGVIEEILLKVFNEKINLISSGRTDKGVHAIYQVSNFYISKNLSLYSIKKQIEKYSNNDIIINHIDIVDENYNSRYNNTERTYIYKIKNIEKINPFDKNYYTYIDYDIDIEKFNEILKEFIGLKDFKYFSKKEKNKSINTIRKVYSCYIVKKNDEYNIYIKATSFLKSMVRFIVGTSLKIYENKISIKYIEDKFKNTNSTEKKYIADPNGLYLYKVK